MMDKRTFQMSFFASYMANAASNRDHLPSAGIDAVKNDIRGDYALQLASFAWTAYHAAEARAKNKNP